LSNAGKKEVDLQKSAHVTKKKGKKKKTRAHTAENNPERMAVERLGQGTDEWGKNI